MSKKLRKPRPLVIHGQTVAKITDAEAYGEKYGITTWLGAPCPMDGWFASKLAAWLSLASAWVEQENAK